MTVMKAKEKVECIREKDIEVNKEREKRETEKKG